MAEILSYIYDFVSVLQGKLDESVKSILLFVSTARGDFDSSSDVDIFIDTNKGSMEKKVADAIGEFEIKCRDTWHLKGVDNPIKCIVGDLMDERWKELRKEIMSNNIVLYSRAGYTKDELSSFHLYEYSLNKYEPKAKMEIIRRLYGYKSKKGKKIYYHEGLAKEAGAVKLENNNILVPIAQASKIEDFFKKSKITAKVKEVWLKK